MEDLLGQRPEGYTNAMAYPIPQVHTSGVYGAQVCIQSPCG